MFPIFNLRAIVAGIVNTLNLSGLAPFAPAGTYPATWFGVTIKNGNRFYFTTGGAVGSVTVEAGDELVALIDAPGQTDANWNVVQRNIGPATETNAGIAEIATQAEADTGTNDTTIVSPLKLATRLTSAFGALRYSEPMIWEASDIGPFASDALIGSTWAWLFPKAVSKNIFTQIRASSNVDNAQGKFLWVEILTTALGAGNADVRLELQCSYLDPGDLATTVTQTLFATVAVTNALADITIVTFSLGTMGGGDGLSFRLRRLIADAADTFTGEVGIAKALQFQYHQA